jgi:Fe2+ transport system protein FeoA
MDWFSPIGIKENEEVEFLQHLPDDTLIFKLDEKEIKMGEGQASKVLAKQKGRSLQINHLGEGEKAKVEKVLGGTKLSKKFEEIGIREEKEITLIKKEAKAPTPKRGTYVVAKIGDQLVTIGRGIAEKVHVE